MAHTFNDTLIFDIEIRAFVFENRSNAGPQFIYINRMSCVDCDFRVD